MPLKSTKPSRSQPLDDGTNKGKKRVVDKEN